MLTQHAPHDRTRSRPPQDTGPAILLSGLTKRYGRQTALADVDLEVRRGEVFGFIGPNGAGKTTTIRLLLDLIRPSSGSARVLGFDARREGVEVRRRVGYLPGELALYEDLTAAQHLAYLASLRGLDDRAVEPLARRLSLELDRPIRTLSKGNKQKVGLVQAFMHTPELLILDEPTGGLDPLVQHEFGHLLEEARERGQTVFLSSHVLSEVDRLADRVGLVHEGRLMLVDDVGALKARLTRRLELRFAEVLPPRAFEGLPGVAAVEHDGEHVTLTLDGPADAAVKEAARHRVLTLSSREPDLDDLFLDLLGGDGHAQQRADQDLA
jgi:ABC-2 type transport system ATP-binding protein